MGPIIKDLVWGALAANLCRHTLAPASISAKGRSVPLIDVDEVRVVWRVDGCQQLQHGCHSTTVHDNHHCQAHWGREG